jgi:predicted nucleic acid-binding protein
VVYYQVYRGLLHQDSKKQLSIFLSYITTYTWSEFDSADWDKAAQLWAELRRRGEQTEDADLLIGVYALQRGAIVVTDNEKDFLRLGVSIENWRR